MRIAAGTGSVCMTLMLLVAAPAPASGAGGIRVSKVEPAAAVSGAAIEVRGKGLKGKGTRVTVGGKPAKVLSARASRLRIVVPRVAPGAKKLVVKRGARSGSGLLRVLKPFKGRISVTPDRSRSKSRQVGRRRRRGHGDRRRRHALHAEGSRGRARRDREDLSHPGQALRRPALRRRGAGRGARPERAHLRHAGRADDHLEAGPSKRLIGFGYANKSRVLDVQPPSGSGRSRMLRIEHFSTEAVAGSSPADFANAVAPLLVEQPMREDVIERVLDLRAVYEDAFGPDFCDLQPRCGEAMKLGLDSLKTRITSRCANTQTLPALQAVRQLVSMESLRQRLGAQDDISVNCREQIMRLVFDPAKLAACGAPARRPRRFEATRSGAIP